jgi:AraC family transcriptional regulator
VHARTDSTKPSHALDGRRLQRVLQFVDENLQYSLVVKDLAAVANLSPFYFSRAFRTATGQAPQRFVRERRLEKAKRLLLEGKLSLAEIALVSSFSSQASFTRAFIRFTGLTPGKFRSVSRKTGIPAKVSPRG